MDKHGLYRWTTLICTIAMLVYLAFATVANAEEYTTDGQTIRVASICTAVNYRAYEYFDTVESAQLVLMRDHLWWKSFLASRLDQDHDLVNIMLIASTKDANLMDIQAVDPLVKACRQVKEELLGIPNEPQAEE